MKKFIIFILSFVVLSSCIFNPFYNDGFSNKKYYYQPYDTLKVYFELSLTQVNVTFKDTSPDIFYTDTVLSKYDFLSIDTALFARYNTTMGFIANINKVLSDREFKNCLNELNGDIQIAAATPVFYTDKSDPLSYMVLINRISTKKNPDIVNDRQFREFCESKGLELIIPSSPYSSSYYIVKNVIDGFEPLYIANEICINDTSRYANPGFYFHMHR